MTNQCVRMGDNVFMYEIYDEATLNYALVTFTALDLKLSN